MTDRTLLTGDREREVLMSTLYLGSHHASQRWWDLAVPLCVSFRTLRPRKTFPRARAAWILDSGAFSELRLNGHYTYTAAEYASRASEIVDAIGQCAWIAPMDWMCEPWMLDKTGLRVNDHLERTVSNFLELRDALGTQVIPVVQGYSPRDYDRCIDLYQAAGVDLEAEPTVGLGSVCKRSRTLEIIRLINYLRDYGLHFHGFGLKGSSYRALRGLLASADSMAWSFTARRAGRNANSPREALTWRARQLAA